MKWAVSGTALVVVCALAMIGPGSYSWLDSLPPPDPAELGVRNEALARAKVLRAEPFDGARVDFTVDPNREHVNPSQIECRFLPTEPTGTTPKFDCELPSGEKIKVKYSGSREIPAEVAATRLLHGLGFGADRMSRVEKVRCYGCVISPFHIRSLMQRLHLVQTFDQYLDYDEATVFRNVAVERKLEGEPIEAGEHAGWAFFELSQIDPARGGATRAEVDALRLMAMFLHHWDNKASNQRLICLDSETADCDHPLAMLQDVGADFGPHKISLEKWSRTPIWANIRTCTLSMKDFPYHGGTFKDVQISEQGRLLLGGRLRQFSAAQIEALFMSAGFSDVPQWVAAFQSRVRQITDRPQCSASPSMASSS